MFGPPTSTSGVGRDTSPLGFCTEFNFGQLSFEAVFDMTGTSAGTMKS